MLNPRRVAAAALFFLAFALAAPSQAAEMVTRKVTGKVVATETRAVPNTIVVETRNHKGQKLIIGAQVPGTAAITRDGRKASLRDVSTGDRVEIVYQRNAEVVARSITLR